MSLMTAILKFKLSPMILLLLSRKLIIPLILTQIHLTLPIIQACLLWSRILPTKQLPLTTSALIIPAIKLPRLIPTATYRLGRKILTVLSPNQRTLLNLKSVKKANSALVAMAQLRLRQRNLLRL